MKKMMMTLTLIITLATSLLAGGGKVRNDVVNSFHTLFSDARNVNWEVRNEFFKASFSQDGEQLSAFFDRKGGYIGYTRSLEAKQLPKPLQQSLAQQYASYTVSEMIAFYVEESTIYYVTLKSGNRSIILESTDHAEWKNYRH